MPKPILYISILLLVLLVVNFNFQQPSLHIYKKNSQVLEEFLSPDKFKSFQCDTVIRLDIKKHQTDRLYRQLYDANIINENSSINYNPPYCVSLVTNKKNNFWGFADYVVFYNLNEGEFICNINSIYSLNSDENIKQIKMKVFQIDALMNLAVVEK